jgi:hypothetical protein
VGMIMHRIRLGAEEAWETWRKGKRIDWLQLEDHPIKDAFLDAYTEGYDVGHSAALQEIREGRDERFRAVP